MSIDQFQLEVVSGAHFLYPIGDTMARPDRAEVIQQRPCIPVRDRQSVDIQDRVTKPGPDQCITDVVHVSKGLVSEALQAVRPESSKQKKAVLSQYT